MRILITGSEGTLGSVLKDALRTRGHLVWGCDLMHSRDSNYIRADVSEYRQLDRAFLAAKPDLVYHFAAEFGRKNGQEYYEQLWKSNCIGTRNVIELCIKYGATMAHASSSEAYGLAEEYNQGQPLREDMLDKFPPKFHNEYALTKYTNERQIHMAVRNDGLDAAIFRFFNVFGPPEPFSPYRSVACQFAYRLLAGLPITVNEEGKRTHLYITDWSRTVANYADEKDMIAFNKHWPGSAGTSHVPVFNIGGDEYASIPELYHMLVEIIRPKDRHSDATTFIKSEEANSATKQPDNEMAEAWLYHKPRVTLKQGLIDTVLWMREQYGF